MIDGQVVGFWGTFALFILSVFGSVTIAKKPKEGGIVPPEPWPIHNPGIKIVPIRKRVGGFMGMGEREIVDGYRYFLDGAEIDRMGRPLSDPALAILHKGERIVWWGEKAKPSRCDRCGRDHEGIESKTCPGCGAPVRKKGKGIGAPMPPEPRRVRS